MFYTNNDIFLNGVFKIISCKGPLRKTFNAQFAQMTTRKKIFCMDSDILLQQFDCLNCFMLFCKSDKSIVVVAQPKKLLQIFDLLTGDSYG